MKDAGLTFFLFFCFLFSGFVSPRKTAKKERKKESCLFNPREKKKERVHYVLGEEYYGPPKRGKEKGKKE